MREHDRFSFVNADLVTTEVERLLDGCDAVYHLAAEPGVRSSWGQRFDRYLRNNIRATQALGFVPAISLRAGLQAEFEWVLDRTAAHARGIAASAL